MTEERAIAQWMMVHGYMHIWVKRAPGPSDDVIRACLVLGLTVISMGSEVDWHGVLHVMQQEQQV